MSDKNNNTEASGGEEDDDQWLYGDTTVSVAVTVDNTEESEKTVLDSATTVPTSQVIHENGGDTQEAGQDDDASDSDDDDDICVTIGDIKTGCPSETTFGATPVNLNIKAAGRAHTLVGSKAKGLDLDAVGSIKGIPVLDVDVESFEEKPWRKPGADISDYFNYGFSEETWKMYSEKQRRLRGSYEGIARTYEGSSKMTVQKGRTCQGDRESWSDYPSSGNLYVSAPRKSSGTIDVIGGQTGCISRVEGRRRHSNEGNNIQVLSETSSDGDPSANKMSSFFPPNIPPPPFPPPPSSVNGVSPLIPPLIPPPHIPINVPPPGISPSPGVPPPSLIPILDSVRSGPPPPPYPFSTGGYSLIPPNIASWAAGAMDSTKACWEYYTRQDRERDRGQDRSRDRGYDKERERGRDREREHSPSSQAQNSEDERARHKESGERGYERYHDRSSREREERHREWRQRDKEEGRHRPSRSRRRRHDSEEDDSRRRHKHKKSKRGREEKETSHELSADQENQSEPTE